MMKEIKKPAFRRGEASGIRPGLSDGASGAVILTDTRHFHIRYLYYTPPPARNTSRRG